MCGFGVAFCVAPYLGCLIVWKLSFLEMKIPCGRFQLLIKLGFFCFVFYFVFLGFRTNSATMLFCHKPLSRMENKCCNKTFVIKLFSAPLLSLTSFFVTHPPLFFICLGFSVGTLCMGETFSVRYSLVSAVNIFHIEAGLALAFIHNPN